MQAVRVPSDIRSVHAAEYHPLHRFLSEELCHHADGRPVVLYELMGKFAYAGLFLIGRAFLRRRKLRGEQVGVLFCKFIEAVCQAPSLFVDRAGVQERIIPVLTGGSIRKVRRCCLSTIVY